jgi:hypothetical protein
MSQWSNRGSQVIPNTGVLNVDFQDVIVPGNNPLTSNGNYTYSYHINCVKPSGESGPTPLTSVLTINGVGQEYTRSFASIDTGGKAVLSNTGEIRQAQAGDIIGVRIRIDPEAIVLNSTLITTSPNRCTLTYRSVTGPGS